MCSIIQATRSVRATRTHRITALRSPIKRSEQEMVLGRMGQTPLRFSQDLEDKWDTTRMEWMECFRRVRAEVSAPLASRLSIISMETGIITLGERLGRLGTKTTTSHRGATKITRRPVARK